MHIATQPSCVQRADKGRIGLAGSSVAAELGKGVCLRQEVALAATAGRGLAPLQGPVYSTAGFMVILGFTGLGLRLLISLCA